MASLGLPSFSSYNLASSKAGSSTAASVLGPAAYAQSDSHASQLNPGTVGVELGQIVTVIQTAIAVSVRPERKKISDRE